MTHRSLLKFHSYRLINADMRLLNWPTLVWYWRYISSRQSSHSPIEADHGLGVAQGDHHDPVGIKEKVAANQTERPTRKEHGGDGKGQVKWRLGNVRHLTDQVNVEVRLKGRVPDEDREDDGICREHGDGEHDEDLGEAGLETVQVLVVGLLTRHGGVWRRRTPEGHVGCRGDDHP